MTIAKTCVCGRRIEDGASRCPACRAQRPEPTQAQRVKAQPWRAAYSHPSHKQTNLERYVLVGGRCEDCGKPLKGQLYPGGVAWEGDHHIPARCFADPVQANTVANKRCRCVPCHRKKTRRDRARRRR